MAVSEQQSGAIERESVEEFALATLSGREVELTYELWSYGDDRELRKGFTAQFGRVLRITVEGRGEDRTTTIESEGGSRFSVVNYAIGAASRCPETGAVTIHDSDGDWTFTPAPPKTVVLRVE